MWPERPVFSAAKKLKLIWLRLLLRLAPFQLDCRPFEIPLQHGVPVNVSPCCQPSIDQHPRQAAPSHRIMPGDVLE